MNASMQVIMRSFGNVVILAGLWLAPITQAQAGRLGPSRAEIPSQLGVFTLPVYIAEPPIDGALLLNDQQRATISLATQGVRANLDALERDLTSKESATKKQRKEAAKRLAEARAASMAQVGAAARSVLNDAQKGFVRRVDDTYTAAQQEVDKNWLQMLRTEAQRKQAQALREPLTAIKFREKLYAMLTDEQRTAIAIHAAEDEARHKAAEKAAEQQRREQAAQLKLEAERKAALQRNFGAFNAAAVGHDWANAYLLMLASALFYPDQMGMSPSEYTNNAKFDDLFEQRFLGLGMTKVRIIRRESDLFLDPEAVVMSNDQAVFVVFRGTESANAALLIKDALNTDANIVMIPMDSLGKGTWVHWGFWNAVDVIYPQLRHEIAAQGGMSGKKLWITGHSLGGAMAQVFALRYATDTSRVEGKAPYAPQGIYTFAAPRAGNGAFKTFFDARFPFCQRWVNKVDIVPMVPPDVLPDPWKYYHVGHTNNITLDNRVRFNDQEVRGVGDPRWHHTALYCRAIYDNMPADVRSKMPVPPPAPSP